jgi:hypothetical protein
VRIVEVIRRANCDVIDPLIGRPTPQLFQMPIESLDLVEEAHVEGEPIEDADGVMRIGGSNQAIAGVLDRLQMPRCDVTADAGNGEVLHVTLSVGVVAAARRITAASFGALTCSE